MRAVVSWADRYDIPLVARSGGHGYNGGSTSSSAMVVDLASLDRVFFQDGAPRSVLARSLGVLRARRPRE